MRTRGCPWPSLWPTSSDTGTTSFLLLILVSDLCPLHCSVRAGEGAGGSGERVAEQSSLVQTVLCTREDSCWGFRVS